MIQESKFLGGDMEHTHLVKGLDFALLQKVSTDSTMGLFLHPGLSHRGGGERVLVSTYKRFSVVSVFLEHVFLSGKDLYKSGELMGEALLVLMGSSGMDGSVMCEFTLWPGAS